MVYFFYFESGGQLAVILIFLYFFVCLTFLNHILFQMMIYGLSLLIQLPFLMIILLINSIKVCCKRQRRNNPPPVQQPAQNIVVQPNQNIGAQPELPNALRPLFNPAVRINQNLYYGMDGNQVQLRNGLGRDPNQGNLSSLLK